MGFTPTLSPKDRKGNLSFDHLPTSVLFAVKKDSEYKSQLVSEILTGLGKRVENEKERTKNDEELDSVTLIQTLLPTWTFSEGRLEPKWIGP